MPVSIQLKNPPDDTLWIHPESAEDYQKWLDELKFHCPSALLIGANSHAEFYLVQGKVIAVFLANGTEASQK